MKKKSEKKEEDSLQVLGEQITSLKDQLARAVADYRNLEARIEKDAFCLREKVSLSLIDKLLPILDDLERSQKHSKDKGIAMIIDQFKKILESEGVEEVESDGKDFNPETMDCMIMCKGKKNIVVETLLKGYKLGDVVIRPAKVKVGEG